MVSYLRPAATCLRSSTGTPSSTHSLTGSRFARFEVAIDQRRLICGGVRDEGFQDALVVEHVGVHQAARRRRVCAAVRRGVHGSTLPSVQLVVQHNLDVRRLPRDRLRFGHSLSSGTRAPNTICATPAHPATADGARAAMHPPTQQALRFAAPRRVAAGASPPGRQRSLGSSLALSLRKMTSVEVRHPRREDAERRQSFFNVNANIRCPAADGACAAPPASERASAASAGQPTSGASSRYRPPVPPLAHRESRRPRRESPDPAFQDQCVGQLTGWPRRRSASQTSTCRRSSRRTQRETRATLPRPRYIAWTAASTDSACVISDDQSRALITAAIRKSLPNSPRRCPQ